MKHSFCQFIDWAGQWVLHILFPRTCFSCGADLPCGDKSALCAACQTQIQRPGPLICRRCGTVLPDGGAYCFNCRGSKAKTFKCSMIRSAYLFNPQVRALIHAFKYQGYSYLADYLGQGMAREFARYSDFPPIDWVIPVPLHPKKLKARGYNQSQLLAEVFCRNTGLCLQTDALRRRADTRSQAKLNRKERLQNMAGAFEASHTVKGKRVLLIDDVATTGATLEGCAEALKKAGAKQVMAFTLAREP